MTLFLLYVLHGRISKRVEAILLAAALGFAAWLICWYLLPAGNFNLAWIVRNVTLKECFMRPVDSWWWKHAFKVAKIDSALTFAVVPAGVVWLSQQAKR